MYLTDFIIYAPLRIPYYVWFSTNSFQGKLSNKRLPKFSNSCQSLTNGCFCFNLLRLLTLKIKRMKQRKDDQEGCGADVYRWCYWLCSSIKRKATISRKGLSEADSDSEARYKRVEIKKVEKCCPSVFLHYNTILTRRAQSHIPGWADWLLRPHGSALLVCALSSDASEGADSSL